MVENSIDLLPAARTRLASCEYSIVNLNKHFSNLNNNEMTNFKRKRKSGSEGARSGQSCIDKEASLGQRNGARENAYGRG